MSTLRRLAGRPIFGAITALIGAIAGLYGSLYADQVKGTYPFTFGGGLALEAIVFWTMLVAFGFALFLSIDAQGQAQRDATAELTANSERLESLIRTLPPDGFLSEFENYLREVFDLAHTSLRPGATRSEMEGTISICVVCLAALARYFDGSPRGVRYAANVMRFQPMPANDQEATALMRKVKFVEPGLDPQSLEGVLAIQPAYAMSIEEKAAARDPVLEFSLPVPRKNFRESGGRTTVLPGAPSVFCTPQRVEIQSDTSKLADWCRKETALRHSVADEVDAYFKSEAGRLIRSFVSLPFGLTGASGAYDPRTAGVVNIHSSAPGILGERGGVLFVPLTLPFRQLLATLFARVESPMPLVSTISTD